MVGAGDTFTQIFFENRKSLSAADIQLAIGKVYCKIGCPEEGLKRFNIALKLFQELESTYREALTNLQVALLNKAEMRDPVSTCEELRSIANELMKCEDWMGTKHSYV
jgi:hypothetical protein